MFGFFKRILGLPTEAEINAAKSEPILVNNKTGDVVDTLLTTTVDSQITDAVTQTTPVKKTRKPRAPKTEKVVKEKAAKPIKAAAKRTYTRSKKV